MAHRYRNEISCNPVQLGDSVKKVIISLFLCVLFSIPVLGITANLTHAVVDVELKGYTDAVERPTFSWETFSTGEFQRKFTSWLDSAMPLKGVLTKTYATLRYELFSLGTKVVGKNGDVFEDGYLAAEFGTRPQYDYSTEENRLQMEQFVNTLASVQEKLQRHGKSLYIYIAPSKVDFHSENVPDKYKNMADEDFIRVVDAFRASIAQTSVPYLICADMKDDLEYPAFYTTGIHWSRTFEQKASERIINELSAVTEKQYRNIVLEDVRESTEPFWRDTDVFDLLNVWGEPDITYYEYNVSGENLEQYDQMRFLINGDSFGQGLRRDILDIYPLEDIFYINYDNYVMDSEGVMTQLHHSWSNLDLNYYLSSSDVVIIEMIEPRLIEYQNSFADYLNVFLDSYAGDTAIVYPKKVDVGSDAEWPSKCMKGIYHKDKTFAWAKQLSQVTITDPSVAEKGLELSLGLPVYLFEQEESVTLSVYVNGVKLHEATHGAPWNGSILITGDQIEQQEDQPGTYRIEIRSDACFVPRDIGLNNDARELAVQIQYIGEAR